MKKDQIVVANKDFNVPGTNPPILIKKGTKGRSVSYFSRKSKLINIFFDDQITF